jgi:hypothetical protein
LTCIDTLQDEILNAQLSYVDAEAGRYTDSFRIIDEIWECRRLFAQLDRNLSATWDIYYRAAREYRKTNGNLRVPKDYVTDNGLTLGSWIKTQRRVYAGKVPGALTDEKIQKLNDLGMLWDVRSDSWEEGYGELLTYYEKYGDADVKARYVSDSGFPLGKWVSNLRGKVKNKGMDQALTPEQQQKLAAVGMIWNKRGEKQERQGEYARLWNTKFELARDYYEKHGDLNIPVAYCVDGVRLGRWISNIRGKRRNPRSSGMVLDENRIRQLDSIGMNWK